MSSKRSDMKDFGEAKFCLGLEITRNHKENKLWLAQQSYMEKLFERFGVGETKPVEGPKLPDERLELVSDKDEIAARVPYRQEIESLMYLMICSRLRVGETCPIL